MNKVTLPAFPVPVRVDMKHKQDGGVTHMVVASLNDLGKGSELTHLQSSLSMNNWDNDPFTVLLPSVAGRDIVYVDASDGAINVILTSTSEMESGEVEIPMIEVEYKMDSDGLGFDPRIYGGDPAVGVLHGFRRAIQGFENELLFDVLGKGVRSQRNKVKKLITPESVSEAMAKSEELGFQPDTAILNTESHSRMRPFIERSKGKLFGMKVLQFPPERRGNKMRNYFVGDAGVSKRTPVRLSFDEDGNMTLAYELGVVIFERNAISCLEEPE